MSRVLAVLCCGAWLFAARGLSRADDSRPSPTKVEPIVAPEPDPKWGGWIGAHERHVQRALDRISAARRRTYVTRPPMVLPGLPGLPVQGGASRATSDASGGDKSSQALPTQLWFGPAAPNPSPGEVKFRVDLPAPAVVRLTVLDVAGRLVGESGGPHPAGRHVLAWMPGDRIARSGVYFALLEVNGRAIGTRRLVLLR